MVGTAQPPTTTLQQQTSSSSVAVGTTLGTSASAEEEAYKRNTDCVYFLASPLTCKKGGECEYRHSDIARVNPRDCWYWLHGNCLNPKCGFRHPPLDGLLGTQAPNPAGATLPPSQPATIPAAPASSKQGVACIFFQKGLCLKGDWCPFLHAPNSINNKALQGQAAAGTTEPPTFKKAFGGLEKPIQEKKVSQTNVLKSVDLPRQEKPMANIEFAAAKYESIKIKKNLPTASAMDDELHRYSSTGGTLVNDQNQVIWSNHVQQPVSLNDHSSMNGKDAEEVSREPSPGFDVLVDDEELRESDYYHAEDQVRRTGDHEGRCEYFDGHSGDYSSMVDADQDIYHDSRGYDSHERLKGQYAWDQRRSSSERMLGGSVHPERQRYGRPESHDQVDESDLRYRLSKHRRANGLRSVINQDYARERLDDRGYQNSQRDPCRDRARQESSLSSRLRGRIKIPGRSPSADGNDLRFDRENERGGDQSGSSQGRLQLSSRLRDRIRGNLQKDINIDSRTIRGLRIGRDIVGDNNANFAGPKSLAELKSRRNVDGNEQHLNDQLGKRKFSKFEGQQQTGDELSFEGPKPLEEILKRKRGSGLSVSGSGTTSGDNEAITWVKREDISIKTKGTVETQIGHFSLSKNDSDLSNDDKNEGYKTTSGVKDRIEGSLSADGQSFNSHSVNEAEVEDGMIVDDGAEDQEPETYEHGDEDSYNEQGDGEEYNLEEGDNGDPEEEYLDDDDDDDDGDDFAKKMGVMY